MLVGTVAAGAAPRVLGPALAAVEDVRVVDFDWLDSARGRRVPVRLYWPSAVEQVPLIVFSHGLGQSRTGYGYLGRHWAANGFASLHVQHVGSDSTIWGGNPFEILDRIDTAADEKEAMARADDLRFALDCVLDRTCSPVADFVDPRRIVAAGHSYGANTTLLVGGAQVIRNGLFLDRRDDRFKAGIVISAPPFYGERDLRSVLAPVSMPTFHVTATEDVIQLPGRHSPFQDRLDIFEAVGTSRKALAVFQGGSHSIFTDRPLTGGIALNPQVKQATAEGVLAFLDSALRGDDRPLDIWTRTWRPILGVAPSDVSVGSPWSSSSRRHRSRSRTPLEGSRR